MCLLHEGRHIPIGDGRLEIGEDALAVDEEGRDHLLQEGGPAERLQVLEHRDVDRIAMGGHGGSRSGPARLRLGRRLVGRQLVDAVEEQGAVDRLGQTGVHAGFLGPSGGGRRRIGRQADDGDAAVAYGSHPVELRGFEAVHDRHVEVHHDRVEGLRFQLVEGLLAVLGHDDPMASGLEDQTDHLLIDPVVVRHEDLQATVPAPDRRLTNGTRGIPAPREAHGPLEIVHEPVFPQDGQDRASRDLTGQAAAPRRPSGTGRRDGWPRARQA